jgi:hypothetical protein
LNLLAEDQFHIYGKRSLIISGVIIMTEREAISVLTCAEFGRTTVDKPMLTDEEERLYEARDIAIEAIQENIKKGEGCEFCNETEKSMIFREGACAAMNDEIYISGDAIIIDYGCKAYDTVQINYCPNCGAKLRKDGAEWS